MARAEYAYAADSYPFASQICVPLFEASSLEISRIENIELYRSSVSRFALTIFGGTGSIPPIMFFRRTEFQKLMK